LLKYYNLKLKLSLKRHVVFLEFQLGCVMDDEDDDDGCCCCCYGGGGGYLTHALFLCAVVESIILYCLGRCCKDLLIFEI
jgi:hypothetical protein